MRKDAEFSKTGGKTKREPELAKTRYKENQQTSDVKGTPTGRETSGHGAEWKLSQRRELEVVGKTNGCWNFGPENAVKKIYLMITGEGPLKGGKADLD